MAKSQSKSEAKAEELIAQGSDILQEDRVEEARDLFSEALSLCPGDEKILGLLGLCHFRLSEFESAQEVYTQLVEKNTEDASYRLNLGLVHLKLDDAGAAIEELDRARELDPGQVRTISYLGLAYARKGEYHKAYEAFLRSDQSALAAEMEQHLGQDERDEIRAKVGAELEAQDSSEGAEGAREEHSDSEDSNEESASSEAEGEDAEVNDAVANMFGSTEKSESEEEEKVGAAEENSDEGANEPAEENEEQVESTEEAQLASTEAEPAPEKSAPQQAVPERAAGLVTQAVAVAIPSEQATAQAAPQGHQAPLPVSQLSTQRLLRPSEGGEALELGAGGVLIARVHERLISRTHGVMVSSGELGFEPATRRVRGRQSDEVFGKGDEALFSVTGEGYMVASACGEVFCAVRLDSDAVYMREEYVFAFEPRLRWENGRIPGSEIPVAQFRGQGCLAMRTPKELLSVGLQSGRVMYVELDVLAGWIGKVVPRIVKPAAGGRASTAFVECSGEGVVLLHDMQGNT